MSTTLTADELSSADVLKLFQQYVIPNYTRYRDRLDAWRRLACLGRRRQSLPRPVSRLGLRALGPLPRTGRGSGPRPIGHADPRAQHLAHRGPRPLGAGAFRAEFRRAGVLLQFGHRGQRGGNQARPAARHAPPPLQDHHLRGQLPRPHARLAHRHGTAQVPRGPRPAHGRLRLRPLRRSRRRLATDRQRNGRDYDRADPRRRRRADSARRLPRRAPQAGRRARSAAWFSTKCKAVSAAPATGSRTRPST